MQNHRSSQRALTRSGTSLRLVACSLLAVVGAGCGDDGDPQTSDGLGAPIAGGGGTAGTSVSPSTGVTGGTTAGTTAGMTAGTTTVSTTGGTTAGGASQLPATPGGSGGLSGGAGAPPSGADAGVASSQPAGTGGGTSSDDGGWCKVKAILDAKCKSCHTTPPVAGAPFPLETYADLTAAHPTMAGKKVYERVAVRVDGAQSQAENLGVMPPGTQLPADDVATIKAWAAAGAKAGADTTCAGAGGATGGTQADATWPLPECDEVYKIVSHGSGGASSPYMVPAGQEIHPQVGWDAPWGNEEVQAIAFKSITDNPKVLHHWILYSKSGAFLTGWAPGEDGIKKWPDDVGMSLPSGAGSLRLDMHYFNLKGTTTEPDNSGVEVCVVKKEHFRKNAAAVTGRLAGFPVIPANSTNVDITSQCKFSGSTPVTLLTASPHAHTYARHMKFTVKKKSGEEIVMHDMPFMFGEQHSYPLDPPVVVEAGDVITTTCTYTNTTNRTVTAGESTTDEMCFNFAVYYPAGKFSCGGGGFIGG